jgi:hypothetical protein
LIVKVLLQAAIPGKAAELLELKMRVAGPHRWLKFEPPFSWSGARRDCWHTCFRVRRRMLQEE